MQTKALLREEAKEKRRRVTSETLSEISKRICLKVCALPSFQSSDILFAYQALPREIDVSFIVREAYRLGKTVAFPKTLDDDGRMVFYASGKEDELEKGRFGIQEPKTGVIQIGSAASLCLVPGLIFDLHGNRMGYGKGYYDRFLASFKGETIGVVMQECLVESLEVGKWDIPVHHVITEEKSL